MHRINTLTASELRAGTAFDYARSLTGERLKFSSDTPQDTIKGLGFDPNAEVTVVEDHGYQEDLSIRPREPRIKAFQTSFRPPAAVLTIQRPFKILQNTNPTVEAKPLQRCTALGRRMLTVEDPKSGHRKDLTATYFDPPTLPA